MTAEIALPWPSRLLSPNGRGHFMAVHDAKKKAKDFAYWATKAEKIGFPAGYAPILVELTFHPKTANKPDGDNAVASCKAYLDGIAKAIGVDDTHFKLAAPVMADPVKGGAVIVKLS